jgi:O-antigen/teichoic acid export membrane protein
MDFLNQEERDVKNIFTRIKNRNFSGNTGQAMKNSGYLITTTLVAKFGSLLFTIILARLLMPELFGLYSLALGTIVFFAGFSDFGISTAMVTFVAKSLGANNKKKAKAYFSRTWRIKLLIVIITSIVLLASAYFIANIYYNKPIFYALLVGGLYLPLSSFLGFFDGIFRSTNKFKYLLAKEVAFQILRLTIIPLSIFFLLKTTISKDILVSIIIFLLAICVGVSLSIFFYYFRKKISFFKEKRIILSSAEKKNMNRFIWPLTLTVLSGAFFGYIDTIMLGHFVSGEYIGYYAAAFSLAASAAAIIGFFSGALFPIFARLKGKALERSFRKTRNMALLISFSAAIVTFFLAKYVILIAYGNEYLAAAPILKMFSLFVLIGPIIGIYDAYFTSQERTKVIAILLIITTIINIGLNWTFITYGLRFGMFEALIGATLATLISRGVYLFSLGFYRKFKK